MVIQRPTNDLLALAINLSSVSENCKTMAQGDSFAHMVNKAGNSMDPLLIKLVRNISHTKEPALLRRFSRSLHQLTGCALKTRNKSNVQDFLCEVLGCIANIQVESFPYSDLIKQHGFLDFLRGHLVLPFSEDDIVLEVVRVMSTLS